MIRSNDKSKRLAQKTIKEANMRIVELFGKKSDQKHEGHSFVVEKVDGHDVTVQCDCGETLVVAMHEINPLIVPPGEKKKEVPPALARLRQRKAARKARKEKAKEKTNE